MTIAFAYQSFLGGGTERVCLDMARRFECLGVARTYIFCCLWQLKWDNPSIEPILLPNRNKLYCPENIEFIIQEIQRRDIRLLITPSSKRSIPQEIRTQTGCKLAYHLHMNPFYEPQHAHLRAQVRAKKSLGRRLDWLLFDQFKYRWGFEGLMKKSKRRYLEMIEAMDYYFVLCPEYKEELVGSLGLNEKQSQKIIPLINTLETSPIEEVKDRKKEIVFFGRLDDDQKGVSMLPELWQRVADRLPDWSLKIYGSGRDEDLIHQGIKQYELERIEVCGYTSDPMPVYREAEILVMTSRFEGWPMVLMEAQGQGCIPMAFDVVAGIRSVIGGGNEAGVLIPPFDLNRYAEELVSLCKDKTRREAIRQRCLEKVADYRPSVNDSIWQQILSSLSPR